MALRLGSYPVLVLAVTAILFTGCHEPTTPSSHQPVAPATPDASAADAHGWGAFYPLAVGNRWEYATRITMQLVPPTGPPGATISVDGDLVHEMVCADDVTGRGYVFERASWQQAGHSGESWITSRQDRSGLYELDGTSAPGISVSTPAAASRPQSMPAAETVRVITAEIGLASTDVSVRASNSSTHENMKQKKAATPMPLAISGTRIFTKKRGNE